MPLELWHWEEVEQGVPHLLREDNDVMNPVLVPFVCPACAKRGAHCLGPSGFDKDLIQRAPELFNMLESLVYSDEEELPGRLEKAKELLRSLRKG